MSVCSWIGFKGLLLLAGGLSDILLLICFLNILKGASVTSGAQNESFSGLTGQILTVIEI